MIEIFINYKRSHRFLQYIAYISSYSVGDTNASIAASIAFIEDKKNYDEILSNL